MLQLEGHMRHLSEGASKDVCEHKVLIVFARARVCVCVCVCVCARARVCVYVWLALCELCFAFCLLVLCFVFSACASWLELCFLCFARLHLCLALCQGRGAMQLGPSPLETQRQMKLAGSWRHPRPGARDDGFLTACSAACRSRLELYTVALELS